MNNWVKSLLGRGDYVIEETHWNELVKAIGEIQKELGIQRRPIAKPPVHASVYFRTRKGRRALERKKKTDKELGL